MASCEWVTRVRMNNEMIIPDFLAHEGRGHYKMYAKSINNLLVYTAQIESLVW